ncbi:MAG: ABC-type transport system involved in resitance to organic solvent, ATP-binding protein [Verrucomicrobiales bacterium]|nr:ABC-type transport system involved in resitance to organic solvent, ATP-binding protein [Verrucomicrobiales bacterium]
MNASPAILEFSDVTIESGSHYESGLWNSSFNLHAGELLLVRMEREGERLPLADATEGLVPPTQGNIQFLGENWQRISADRAAGLRGKIGRLFEDEGWITDLEVDQNIMLAERHHTRRSEKDITEEALQLARVFGLPGLPRGLPESMRRWDLRKAACIRAFLGQPAFIILEQPVRGVYADLLAPLISAVQSARRRGAAVLWTVTDLKIWNHPGIFATTRARMFGSQLQVEEKES